MKRRKIKGSTKELETFQKRNKNSKEKKHTLSAASKPALLSLNIADKNYLTRNFLPGKTTKN